jgi:hypothetical protein
MERDKGILLLYHRPAEQGALTIMEHVHSFARYSRFRGHRWTINTALGFSRGLSGFKFDAVVFRYSLVAIPPYPVDEYFDE